VGTFLPIDISKYYKLPKPDLLLNNDFMAAFHKQHDVGKLVASWWKEYRKFINRTSGWYIVTGLREPYMYLMVLICWLYGEKDCSWFIEAWMSLAYTLATTKKIFNWGSIIAKQLSD